jgi:hypothetical protein
MVNRVPYFEDASGKPWKTEFEAWKADIALWLVASEAINDASATVLVSYIASGGSDRADELAQMLNAFKATMPAITAIAVANEFQQPASPPPPLYRLPNLHAVRARCMGGGRCNHGRDECTADPDYQRWMKIEAR